jgi:alanyl-tRNA synthetase
MTELSPQFLAEKTWDLYQSHGVPIEVSEDILEKRGYTLDREYLANLIKKHQELSQSSSQGQFKSGVGTDSSKGKALHTTTHILHKVLRDTFGEEVRQMGSAITEEKARFDFNVEPSILDESKLGEIESQVQAIIDRGLMMDKEETTPTAAKEAGAIGLFGEKYGEKVTVYKLTDKAGHVYSMEFCAGPHITNTDEIGKFKILKKKSIGNGLSRLEFDVNKTA